MKKIKKIILTTLSILIITTNISLANNNQQQKPEEQKPQQNQQSQKEQPKQPETKKEDPKSTETQKEQPKQPETIKEEPKPIETIEETKQEDIIRKDNEPVTKIPIKPNKIIENVDQNSQVFGSVPNRQFLQIVTKNNTVLYLMIDYLDQGQEVKLLSEVTDKDIIDMAVPELKEELSNKVLKNNSDNTVKNDENSKTSDEELTDNDTINKKDNSLFMLGIGLVLMIIGVFIFLKLGKKKKDKNNIYSE